MFSVCECVEPHFHPVQCVTVIRWPLCSRGFSLHKAHFVTADRLGPAAGLQYLRSPRVALSLREEPLKV